MYSKKFKFLVSAAGVASGEISALLRPRYDTLYCGLYSHDDGEEVHVYIQNKNKMAWSVVAKLLGGVVDIKDVSVYSKVQGTMLCETGAIPKHGGRRVSTTPVPSTSPPSTTIINNDNSVNTNNDNSVNTNNNADQRVAINNFFPVALNPIGTETIDHITAESMASCYTIDPAYNGVVSNFSELLYGLNENLNLKCGSKSSTCSAFTEKGWVSQRKDIGYDSIYDNITEKSLEAMSRFREDLTADMIKQHEDEVDHIDRLKNSRGREEYKDYVDHRNSGVNLVGENINNRIKNFHLKNGKRLKFT